MNEENQDSIEQNEAEWQEPPLPEDIIEPDEPAQMSEVGTLGSIFFEPGATFEDLRRKPRFILALLIIVAAFTAFQISFIEKLGMERIMRDRIESNSRAQQMPTDQKEAIIKQQTSPAAKYISFAVTPIALIILFILGGLVYWLGANAMGGEASFLRGVSVWVYSSFPPWLIWSFANILVLFLKSVDNIDLVSGQSGLVSANPNLFLNLKGAPALASLLGSFDLFVIWGWILAAIGLQKVAKLSKGSAWAIVLLVALTYITVSVSWAFIFG